MIVFDFLIYNLTNWYAAHRSGLKWSTSLERAVYVTGIITMLWILDFLLVINTFLLKNSTLKGSIILFVALGIAIMLVLKYIYINKGRFERIDQISNKPFNISDNIGQALSISLLFLPLLIFGILLLLA